MPDLTKRERIAALEADVASLRSQVAALAEADAVRRAGSLQFVPGVHHSILPNTQTLEYHIPRVLCNESMIAYCSN